MKRERDKNYMYNTFDEDELLEISRYASLHCSNESAILTVKDQQETVNAQ